MSTVHVRCGEDIREGLARAGFGGTFLCFADPYCQGPVRDLPRDAFIAERATFIAHAYGGDASDLRQRLTQEYGALATVGQVDRVVLWFEHDSYDQLILGGVLAALAQWNHPRVELICIDRHPRVAVFRGLGQLLPDDLRGLWPRRRPVGAPHYALGVAMWTALTASDPSSLWNIARGGTPAVPVMAGALMRHLAELPATEDGLSMTEHLVLRAVVRGATRVDDVFRALGNGLEPLPFLGDVMVASVIRNLAGGRAPALMLETSAEPWPQHAVALTPLGRRLLAGDDDWVTRNQPDRWVGGVHCTGGYAPWRWSRKARQLVRGQ